MKRDKMQNRFHIIVTIIIAVVVCSIFLTGAKGAPLMIPISETQGEALHFEFLNMWEPRFKDLDPISIFDIVQPYGIALSAAGDVYITDSGNNRVVKFSPEAIYITEWGSSGSGEGQFDTPEGIAVDQAGYVYVLDWNNRVQKFTSDGTFVKQWGGFGGARGVAVSADNMVYVADVTDNRILKFTSDGILLTEWGEYGPETGQFQFPYDLAVDQNGYVYVTDYYNSRVQKFTSEGDFVTTWGEYGDSSGDFQGPWGITVSASGSVYVVDKSTSRIQKFSTDGDFELEWGSEGDGVGEFSYPTGIATAPDGSVFVVDTDNNRIQLFTEDGVLLNIWLAAEPPLIPTSITYYDSHGRPWYMTSGEGALLKLWTYDDANLTETVAYPQENHQVALIGIVNDHENFVSIAVQDNTDRCIQNFTSEGVFLSEWCGGQFGSDHRFWAIRAIDKDQSGNVYLADTHVWTPYSHSRLAYGDLHSFPN